MCRCSIGRTGKPESTVRSSRNPISKPMRRVSGKLRTSGSKVTPNQLDTSIQSPAVDGSVAKRDGKTDSGVETDKDGKVGSALGSQSDWTDLCMGAVGETEVFLPPLAERVKLRRMSQSNNSSDGSVDKMDDLGLKSIQLAAEKAAQDDQRTVLRGHTAAKVELQSNKLVNVCSKQRPGSVTLATTKKNTAIRRALRSSAAKSSHEQKSVKPVAKRSLEVQAGSSKRQSQSAVSKLKNLGKVLPAKERLKPKTSVSKSGAATALGSIHQAAPPDAVRLKGSGGTVEKKPRSKPAGVSEKMPRLTANRKQRVSNSTLQNMPILKQETSLAEFDRSAKRSPRKRQQSPPPATVKSKSPKLLATTELKHTVKKRGDSQNNVIRLSSDDMPCLSVVESVDKVKPLNIVVDQFDGPPELDRSPLCDVDVATFTSYQLPDRSLGDSQGATVLMASSPSANSPSKDASKNSLKQKPSPARPKRSAGLSPVSKRTAVSQNNCSLSPPVMVTQAVCNGSSQVDCRNSGERSDLRQLVTSTVQTNCAVSSLQCSSSSKHPGFSEAETENKDKVADTEPAGEIVPYMCPTSSVAGRWQVPCGLPMAPFVITGMYPLMGSGYGCPTMPFPSLISPAIPAAGASVLSGRGCTLPLPQYSSYRLSDAAPVVPLYMSPVIGPFMQSGSRSSQVNLVPFLAPSAVQSATTAAATTLVLRPSLHNVGCVLPSHQQQVNICSCDDVADDAVARSVLFNPSRHQGDATPSALRCIPVDWF